MSMCNGQEEFANNCFSIDMGGFDLILSVDYLLTLGPILWDFEALCMAFRRNNRCLLWKGMGLPCDNTIHRQQPPPTVVGLPLQQYSVVFDEPHGAPLVCPYDHRIHLLSGTTPLSLPPTAEG
jgi:hypothetical protein